MAEYLNHYAKALDAASAVRALDIAALREGANEKAARGRALGWRIEDGGFDGKLVEALAACQRIIADFSASARQGPRREQPCPACGRPSAAQPEIPSSGEQDGASPLDAKANTFDRAAMRKDFLRRWKSFNATEPTEGLADQYVSEWAANLTREGWAEA